MTVIEKKNIVRIGTAGWSVPSNMRAQFPSVGTLLQKYSTRFNAVEINSSFYRPHRVSTYEKWASQTSDNFSFSVKLPRAMTHDAKLVDIGQQLEVFIHEVSGLGPKLGCLLIQLPPSLQFSSSKYRETFTYLREAFTCSVVCEPRHPSWFTDEADAALSEAGIARVAASPSILPNSLKPGGDMQTCYYRLHGEPKMYYSNYTEHYLSAYSASIKHQKQNSNVWCIFDNTANGYAFSNATDLNHLIDN